LFPTHDNYEHLAMMEKVLGPLPVWMTRKVSRPFRKYFDFNSRLNFPKHAEKKNERALKRLPYFEVNYRKDLVTSRYSDFRELVYDMLEYLPSHRTKARDALSHRFFKGQLD